MHLFDCNGSSLCQAGSSFQLHHVGSLVVASKLLVMACGIQFPYQAPALGVDHREVPQFTFFNMMIRTFTKTNMACPTYLLDCAGLKCISL